MTRRIDRRLLFLAFGAISCGPPKPVVVYLPASVTVDSSARARRNVPVVSSSQSFWEAMATLDTGYVKRHQVTDDERAFARAMGSIIGGMHGEATLTLDSVRRVTTDSRVGAASRLLMTAMLQYQDQWGELAAMGATRSPAALALADRAGVEAWANAFKGVAPRRMEFPETPVILPLTISAAGTPVIPVSVNGRPRFMWLDTGSSMSILASDVAADAQVLPIGTDTLEIATTTGRVSALPTAIGKLELGGITASNVTAMIVASELMRVQLAEKNDPELSIRIDGVIGFDIMKRLDIRIDYVNKQVILRAPVPTAPPRGGRNFFWVGTPVVRMVTSKGVPLHFYLDTGAQETYSTDLLPLRTRVKTFGGERRLVGGLAGVRVVRGRFIDELHVTTGGQPILLRKLLVFVPAYATFVSLDGVLGSDVGQSGVVRIDATNGLFLLEAASRPRTLRPRS